MVNVTLFQGFMWRLESSRSELPPCHYIAYFPKEILGEGRPTNAHFWLIHLSTGAAWQ